jgi:uncharacterized protein YndB with AHSA1/START domain
MRKETTVTDKDNGRPAPLRISRIFAALPETVFKAWSTPGHVMRWFSPAVFSVPRAIVEMRVGGPFEVCMRGPDGTEHWTRGTFAEVTPSERLVLDLYAADAAGRRLFGAYTEVTFTPVPHGTRMDVVQTYSFDNPILAAGMVAGAPLGWSQTLDKLAEEVARIESAEPDKRSAVHATFQIERTYDAPAGRVFRALTVEAEKRKWFGGPPEQCEELRRAMDIRPGGAEHLSGRWKSGMVTAFDAVYYDVVPNERLIYTYEMRLNEVKISVSLATMQLTAAGAGRTTLTVTEQGAFLDGYDDAGAREQGTGHLLDALGASLGA